MERIFKSSLLKNKVRKQMLYNVEKKKRRKERKLGREERAKRRKLLGEDVSMWSPTSDTHNDLVS